MEQKKKTEITKQKILDAAEAEFSELGLAAARVDSIARSAAVNKQLIYAHFGSKEGLYSAVLSRVYRRLSEHQNTIAKKEFEGVETVREIVIEYFETLLGDPAFVRLMLWENLNGAKYVQSLDVDLYESLRRILKEGMERGMIRRDLDLEQTVLSMNMFCFSAFSNVHTLSRIFGKDLGAEDELRKRAEHISDVLIKYIFG